MASPPARYVIDACAVVAIKGTGLSIGDFVGSADVVSTYIVNDELLFGLDSADPLYRANIRLLAQLGDPITNEPRIVFRARDLVRTYAAHHKPLAENDALIAAAALVYQRTLITVNVTDFHYIDRLWYVDPRDRVPGQPLLQTAVIRLGAISSNPCCQRLRALRASLTP